MWWIPLAMMAASTAMKMQGARQQAAAAKANAKATEKEKAFEAAQARQAAGQAIAASQIAAEEQRRQARYVQSRTLAVAAASGGGVSDPTIVNMLARIAGEGVYRANVALYGGEERARLLNMQAAAADYEGKTGRIMGNQIAKAANIQAVSAGMSGATSLYEKYNAMPKNTGPTIKSGFEGYDADQWF